MMFFEVYVPKGALSVEQRSRLGERLISEFLTAEESAVAPAEVIAATQAIQQVVFHEVEPWIVGGSSVGAGAPPFGHPDRSGRTLGVWNRQAGAPCAGAHRG
jgi:hypothetical protein